MQGALMGIVRADTHVVHEIRAASGTTVREYLTTTGTVFAVAWQGPWLPDMRQVLGTHFDQYQQAVHSGARTRKSRGSIVIEEPDLVVQMTRTSAVVLRPRVCARAAAARPPAGLDSVDPRGASNAV